MKLVFVSDIHGSLTYAQRAKEIFKEEKGDYLIILGDILYHGPRNPLPEGYNPKEVADIFNGLKDKIVAVRGNCDSEVDQMLIDFPIMADYSTILEGGKRIFLTHGHIFNSTNMPNISSGDVMVHGHTHVLGLTQKDGVKIINPGSISLPKENNPRSYGILEDNVFTIKDLEGNKILEICL